MKNKVLVLCHDTVGAKMAGPGIRYQNIAQELQKVAMVTLGVYSDKKQLAYDSDLEIVQTVGDTYQAVFDKYDVIFAQWLSGEMLRYAKSQGKVVIIDLYAPVPIEYLASLGFSDRVLTADDDLEFSGILETYRQYLTNADFLVCSNERQRDFWVGFMTASDLLTPTSFRKQSGFSKLALSPMGMSAIPPKKVTKKLRTRLNLGSDDFILLWTGGIWDWFDAQLVIRSISLLKNPKVKLVFMGTQHPNSKVPEMAESKLARNLSDELQLTDKSVYFMDGWIDYDDRANYLMDADAAIYADKESLETRFSHRTRVLDHIWAGIPTICSKGDYLSHEIERLGLGIVVAERTPEAFAAAVTDLSSDNKLRKTIQDNIKTKSKLFTWEVLSAELVDFVKNAKAGDAIPLAAPAKTASTPSLTKAKKRLKNSIKVLLGRIDV